MRLSPVDRVLDRGADLLPRIGCEEPHRGRGGRLVLLGRGLQDTVHLVGPEHLVVGEVNLPAADVRHRLRGFQQQVEPLAGPFGHYVIGHVGKGAYHAAAGQRLRADLERTAGPGGAQVVGRNGRIGGVGDVVPRVQIHQAQVGAKVTARKLEACNLMQGRMAGQQSLGQLQQLADTGVVVAEPPVHADHENTLADAAQGGLQLVGLLGQLAVKLHQGGLRGLAVADIGMGSSHAYWFALAVAAYHHAARQNPLPAPVLATHPMLIHVGGRQAVEMGLPGGVAPGAVVRMGKGVELVRPPDQLIIGVTIHLLEAL